MTLKQLNTKLEKAKKTRNSERSAGRDYSIKMIDACHDIDLLNSCIRQIERVEAELKLLKL